MAEESNETDTPTTGTNAPDPAPAASATALLFQAPETVVQPARPASAEPDDRDDADDRDDRDDDGPGGDSEDGGSGGKRRRRRGGRRRNKGGASDSGGEDNASDKGSDKGSDQGPDKGGQTKSGKDAKSGKDGGNADKDDKSSTDSDTDDDQQSGDGQGGSSRRRRRRRREGEGSPSSSDDPENTVTKVRKGRSAEDEITAVTGSTRLEAKKQRRREGREAGRRRAPIVSEAEFLARRESVDRVMVIRQRKDLTQIGVLEDKVLVEHYVARESQTSLIGNVYLGRVQNVLPSMEAAFIDIGKGRNAVLYAGEVNWSALGHKEGTPRKIESVLESGQMVLVQVTKDPVGHKGARLTSQISLAGRFLVYVPDGNNSGISRKLPDTERARLKALLKEIVPESASVIVRTAAEGASEEELTRDVERLKARWEDVEKKSGNKGSGPQLLHAEPDLTLKVVRDLFTEDFGKLVIQGDDAWETVHGYVEHVAPDLVDRLEHYEAAEGTPDVFAAYRIDEQIAKGVDRKVWLPSGGSLIIDRTEAMTVIDVNTGKFTGSGGNLEETVTKNNLEAAEEIVRQLRLRDIGGIIVVDFIDMVLESNRDLVLRRLVECLGRDRTRHQVAEVTSLGLVQMTRKRIGTGLLEAFSESCTHCQGRGLVVHDMPVEPKKNDDGGGGRRKRGKRGKGGNGNNNGNGGGNNGNAKSDKDQSDQSGKGSQQGGSASAVPSPKAVAAMAETHGPLDEDQSVVATEDTSGEAGRQEPAKKAEGHDAGADASGAAPQTTEAAAGAEPVGTPAPSSAEQAAPAAPAEAESAPPAAEPTTVVTTTRRRAASRPAGPPAGEQPSVAGADVPPPNEDAPDTPEATAEDADASAPAAEETVEHVPVKKKGGRKR
ncbi:Rne/Rng family ribonuclease [Nocardioides panacisoli]|nr:Rne/Rng family ribonuclease [Nocardioides panacisoli]QYJ04436.1 Rne/Rng family ribonuclease [Nocardioides panacisoli]